MWALVTGFFHANHISVAHLRCVCTGTSVLVAEWVSLCGCTRSVCSLSNWLVHFWVVPTFCLLWVMLLWTFVYRFPCGQMLSFFSDIYLGLKLPGLLAYRCFLLLCGNLFHVLDAALWHTQVLTFDEVPFTYFFFRYSCFLCLRNLCLSQGNKESFLSFLIRVWLLWNSLAGQWLSLHVPKAGVMGLIPGWGAKVLHAARRGQKNKNWNCDPQKDKGCSGTISQA